MSFVPFISSGASSRLHYVLVRKVESALSPESVNDIISVEMRSIVEKFTEAKVSLVSDQCHFSFKQMKAQAIYRKFARNI